MKVRNKMKAQDQRVKELNDEHEKFKETMNANIKNLISILKANNIKV